MSETQERCKDCRYYKVLKKDFTVGAGFTKTNCCVLFAHEDDGFVVEVTANDRCECYAQLSNRQ